MRLSGFEKLSNTRDLGGIATKNGKIIKKNKLLRSGRLYFASKKDIEKLVHEFKLSRIIDFRNESERKKTPDPIIEDIIYIHLPIEREKSSLTTKEKQIHTVDIDYIKNSIEAMNFDVEKNIQHDYLNLLQNKNSLIQFKQFILTLLDEVDGSTLYHCSAGKDRVGIATILLLGILGVEIDILRTNYLKSNDYLRWRIDYYTQLLQEKKVDNKIITQLPSLIGVKESYIDTVLHYIQRYYGTIENYCTTALSITQDTIEKIQSIYLE